MFISSILKNRNSSTKEIFNLIMCQKGYWDKVANKCVYYSNINSQYNNKRNLLQNDTLTTLTQKESLSDYQKHIRLIIIIAIIIGSISFLIGFIFLILYIRKKCREMKEKKEEESKEKSKDAVNSKKSKKDKMTLEMSNINSRGKSFLRGSTPIPLNRNKHLSFNPLSNSIKLRNSYKIKLNVNDMDKIINNNIEEEKSEDMPKINNEYSDYTFRSNTDYKDNDFEDEVLDDV